MAANDDNYTPHIMDSDLPEPWSADQQMFDSAFNNPDLHDLHGETTPFDYNQYLNNDAFSSPAPGQANLAGYPSPAKVFPGRTEQTSAPLPQHSSLKPRSHMSSSPDSSSQDSSSESSGRRKRRMTSSNSSPSALFDGCMDGHGHMDEWSKDPMAGLEYAGNPRDSMLVKREIETDVDTINKNLAANLEVHSSSSSPALFNFSSPDQTVAPSKLEQHSADSQSIVQRSAAPKETGFFIGSRDESPMSGLSGSQDASPGAMFGGAHSPAAFSSNDMFQNMPVWNGSGLNSAFQTHPWQNELSPTQRPMSYPVSDLTVFQNSILDDPEKPANGGEVRICQNCVQRERKRAARKRVKKQEDEEAWAEYEYERVIVFNDKEYKEWQPVTPPKNDGSANSITYSPNAMQIEVPMRIACYCRHQGEKNGFRVIFTIKDHLNNVVAQAMTTLHQVLVQSGPYMTAHDPQFSMMNPLTIPPYNSGPSTPGSSGGLVTPGQRSGSIDNMAQMFYSVPNSAHHSRAPSPSMGRQPMGAFTPTNMSNVVGTTMSMIQPQMDSRNQVAAPPQIYKVTPHEYSKSGGIEVSCLGSNFTRNMDILFGDTVATTTTFWNSQLLIVRRLILKGADPMLRSLPGYLASDFAVSHELLDALQRVRSHRRTRSAGSASFPMRSRASSIASAHSMWESSTPSHVSDYSSAEADYEDEAYEEIYPENADKDTDVKKMSVAQAAADHLLDEACAEQFDAAESSDAKSSLNVELGKKSLTKEEQEQVRRAHAQKLKRIRSDRNLFFIWIPLLLLILCAMLRSKIPQLLAAASAVFGAVQERTTSGRIVEVA
ncbi:putative membrane-tethered transcription factor protein [Neofusicoccum parvum UCRNP2]|uniref:Putative membrane-tethered transcription factor protein n=1 Tax=Botryosphaeria parva (strain UCR-NP2) TaxID=1287680 RepID=R1EP18_BOTPV|nr:putative membrane-tethered transcription factor protein [Neofusicoccum parvum UCRNP2]